MRAGGPLTPPTPAHAANFRTAEVADITGHVVLRAHRRYGLSAPNADVTLAWTLLANSTYTMDLSVQVGRDTHVQRWTLLIYLLLLCRMAPASPTSPPTRPSSRRTASPPCLPSARSFRCVCPTRRGEVGCCSAVPKAQGPPPPSYTLQLQAWGAFLAAAESIPDASLETFRFDLVNLGREILAQLSCPVSTNFTDAVNAAAPLNASLISSTGALYSELLADVDTLVATDTGFLLGPWLAGVCVVVEASVGRPASRCRLPLSFGSRPFVCAGRRGLHAGRHCDLVR